MCEINNFKHVHMHNFARTVKKTFVFVSFYFKISEWCLYTK